MANQYDRSICRRIASNVNRALISGRKPAFVIGFAWLAYFAPASAASAPTTRLVKCAPGTCLLGSGHRDSTASQVRINGQAVTVDGKRKWRVRLPIETVRDWSAPFARTIEITLNDFGAQGATSERADLPIGLMGHTDLASLEVATQ